jgi:arylsulfatase A-like enzyme
MIRRQFLSTCAGAAMAPARRPNIVVILTDDLGFADLGCYGSKLIRTPSIDRLARDGVLFTHAYANAPVCSPTRAALMTGRYQHRLGIEYVFHGKRTEGKGLAPGEAVLPGQLKAAGYHTAMTGKWHLGREDEFGPNRHGFDEFFGFRDSDHDYYSHRNIDGTPDLYDNNHAVTREGYSTDLFGEWAAQFIGRRRDSPYFLYAAFNAPHWPFQPPGKPSGVRTRKTWTDGTRETYIQMVERLDTNVGRILHALEETGAAANTLVIFTNDNGGDRYSDNRPAFHHKFTLWEGGIRVPLIMRWPGKLPRAKTCGQAAITMDLTASILEAAGAAPLVERQPDGINLLPVAARQAPPHPRTLFWRHRNLVKAVRHGDWKMVVDQGYPLLFNLRADPGERADLALSAPGQLREMQKLLQEWESEMAAAKPPWTVV